MRATTVKFLAFTTVMVLIFAGLAIVFSQARFSSTDGYRAVFTNASGLKSGEKVRIAGVPVGSVKGVEVELRQPRQGDVRRRCEIPSGAEHPGHGPLREPRR